MATRQVDTGKLAWELTARRQLKPHGAELRAVLEEQQVRLQLLLSALDQPVGVNGVLNRSNFPLSWNCVLSIPSLFADDPPGIVALEAALVAINDKLDEESWWLEPAGARADKLESQGASGITHVNGLETFRLHFYVCVPSMHVQSITHDIPLSAVYTRQELEEILEKSFVSA